MNKRIYALVCLIIALNISGCGGRKSDDSNSVQTESRKNVNEVSKGFSTDYKVKDAKDGYFIVSKLDEKLYGLLDPTGDEVLPLEYDSISFPESEKAQAVIVKSEGKMGLYDYDGNEILPLEYEDISNYGDNSDYYLVEKSGIQSLMELSGKIYKTLNGNYDAVFNNTFLVSGLKSVYTGNEYSCSAAYDLDEQLLYECRLEKDQKTEYSDIKYLNSVNGLIKLQVLSTSPPHSSLMDSSGNILLTSSYIDPSYWDIKSLQDDNLFIITGSDMYLYNLSTGTISEQPYHNIVRADDNTIIASRTDNNIDIYNLNGEIERTLELGAESLMISENSTLIIVEYGNTYRIYNDEGNQISDERFLDAEFIEGFLMVQNLDGEYGLMDDNGDMRIPFGEMGNESYGGKEWDETYVFDDTFCIVTEDSNGCNVRMF